MLVCILMTEGRTLVRNTEAAQTVTELAQTETEAAQIETEAVESETIEGTKEVEETVASTTAGEKTQNTGYLTFEECLEPLSYLGEDEEITDLLESIIQKRDEEFLAKLEEEALLAKIKRENEYAQTSVTKDMEKFKEEEGKKLLEEDDKKNGDVPTYSFDAYRKKLLEQQSGGSKQVQSIQDVFYSNTDKTAADYEHSYTFKITAYCPCSECNGPWSGGATATGVKAQQGRTIAVDPRVIPYGTKVLIGGHEFVAEDCGGAIKGARIDLYLSSHTRCNSWGVRYLTVSWNGGSQKLIDKLVK